MVYLASGFLSRYYITTPCIHLQAYNYIDVLHALTSHVHVYCTMYMTFK